MIRKILVFVSLTAVLTNGGCVSGAPSKTKSAIDAKFKLKRILQTKPNLISESPGVRAYQSVLSKTLGSQCQYFPSDSAYHVMLARKCGSLKSTFRSMARSFNEYDAASLGFPLLIHSKRIEFEDLPRDCSWL